MIARLNAALAATVLLVGCGAATATMPVGTSPDLFLLQQGLEHLEDKDWFDARQNFLQLIDSYPQSPHRMDAKIGMGDAHYTQDSAGGYVDAINEYREFLTFYPSHTKAAYAQYRIGMSNFNQMRRPERDQSKTRDAIEEFEIFLERYPNNELLPEVEARLRDSKDRLKQAEYLVGYFYFKQKWYPGAIIRFREILDTDPGFTGRDAVYFHLAESLMTVQLAAEALPYYERLITEFEQSEFLEESWARVREIKPDDTDPPR